MAEQNDKWQGKDCECDDFQLAGDAQIENMRKEYAALGVASGKNESAMCVYPLPVYMIDKCFAFCKYTKDVLSIFEGLDRLFVERNKRIIDFIVASTNKNCIDIALKGNITQEIFVPLQRMPIKQSMYRLLELFNLMSIVLFELSEYDKSVCLRQVLTRHLLSCSILHGLCI